MDKRQITFIHQWNVRSHSTQSDAFLDIDGDDHQSRV